MKESLIFEQASPNDAAALHKIDSALFGGTTWSYETFEAELSALNRYYLLAKDAKSREIVGFAGSSFDGETVDLLTISVLPSHRRLGIGKSLLNQHIKTAKDVGAKQIMLEVRSDNGPAINLYKSLRFEQISIRKRYYKTVDALVLRLVL
jgi:ribosomal-protein-alanine N-acetyltransferase